jgi:hypothetical protein
MRGRVRGREQSVDRAGTGTGRVLSREVQDPLRVPFSGGTDSAFAPARLTEGLIVVDNGNDASLTPADPRGADPHRPIHGLNDSGPDERRLDRRSLIQIDVGRGRLAQRGEEIESHAMIDLVAAGPGFALVPSSVQECQKTHIVCRRLDLAAPDLDLSSGLGPWNPRRSMPARAGSLSGEGICNRCIRGCSKALGQPPAVLDGRFRLDQREGEAVRGHHIVALDDAVLLDAENLLEVDAAEREKGGRRVGGRPAELVVEGGEGSAPVGSGWRPAPW